MAFNALTNKSVSVNGGDKRQKIMLAAAAVIILACAGVIYFVFFRPSGATEEVSSFIDENLTANSQEVSIDEIIKEIDFDADFLKSEHFQTLKTFKEWPLEIGQTGRSNPFSY